MGRRKTISDEDLLTCARDVFVERGFAGTTREIAKRSGVSEALVFQRYATKADLFFAAMALPAVDLQALFEAPGHSARGKLASITAAMVDYFRDSMPVLLPLLSTPGSSSRRLPGDIPTRRSTPCGEAWWSSSLERGTRAGSPQWIRELPPSSSSPLPSRLRSLNGWAPTTGACPTRCSKAPSTPCGARSRRSPYFFAPSVFAPVSCATAGQRRLSGVEAQPEVLVAEVRVHVEDRVPGRVPARRRPATAARPRAG